MADHDPRTPQLDLFDAGDRGCDRHDDPDREAEDGRDRDPEDGPGPSWADIRATWGGDYVDHLLGGDD